MRYAVTLDAPTVPAWFFWRRSAMRFARKNAANMEVSLTWVWHVPVFGEARIVAELPPGSPS